MRTQIDPKVLNELLDYDAVTGILSWKTRPASYFKATASRSQEAQAKWWNGLHAWKRACMPDAHKGYLRVNILYSSYPAHRIIWAMVHGRWPENCIDHIDGDKANNRITNLREATVAENSRNRSAHGRSRYRGVSWRTKQNCWVAAIRTDGKVTFLGCFKDDAEAAKAYDQAAIVQHGKFARLNFPAADYSARIMSAIEPAGVGVETPPPSTHVRVDFNKLYSHPLAQSFYDLTQQIERLGTSPEMTSVIVAVQSVKSQVEAEINRLLQNAASDGALLTRYHRWCEKNGCAPSTSDLYGDGPTPPPQSRASVPAALKGDEQ